MSLYDCTFIRNYATSNGGAVAAVGEAPDDWEIFNCTFIDNSANDCGGAFYSHAEQSMGSIINSTFINNRARVGAAIYNYGYTGTIDRCIFVNNTANSMIYGYYADGMIVSNSIIVNNYGDNLIDIPNPIIDNNWWGTTADDTEAPVVSGLTLTNYYILNMTVDDDSADITLNNLYDNGVITTSYDRYVLPSINLTLKGNNVEIAGSVALGASGMASVEHAPSDAYTITVGYNGVELTREVKPTFKWLSNKINGEGSEFSLEQDCIYDSTKDYILTNGIEFAKDMTIDGQGHIIDARKSSNMFYFDDDTNSYSLTLKNIIFANAVGTNGAVVYFKGNKIEIINCTFINNTANLEGDAVYVANALSNENIIIESVFTGNTGSNSIVFINMDSNANLKVTDSLFINNSVAKNIKGTPNVIAEHNWMGSSDENNVDISKTENVTVNNWLFLKIDAISAMQGSATLSLNNVYDHGILFLYNNTISSKSSEILNNGGKIISPCAAAVNAGTTFVYGDKTKFIAVITDDNGNLIEDAYQVYFNVGGKLIKSTYDSAVGEYVAEYVFGSAGLVKVVVSCPNINIADNRGVDITVLKKNAAITAKYASYIINYGGKYSITLKDSNGRVLSGEKVTFTLNGKAIGSATTNAKGVATITLTAKILKTAKAGKKNLVIRLTSSNYNVAAKTVKIAINKEKTKIVAKNKAFKKSQKTKKYVMTLKNSKGKAIKGVKLTLKVKGKAYTAKTNAKGKATFKITKLTKNGKFKATIKFKGNAYYKAVTKNVKITIR